MAHNVFGMLMTKPRPLKKSESIEIRIPHATKLAFMARCRDERRSASEALRGFIDGQLEAPPKPAAPLSSWRWSGSRTTLRLLSGVAVAAAVGAAALPSLARPDLRGEFDRLDANHDGVISLEELSRGAAIDIDVRLDPSRAISPGEHLTLGPARANTPAANARLRALILRIQFARLDANGDGKISFDEFRSYYEQP